jgi:nitrilase
LSFGADPVLSTLIPCYPRALSFGTVVGRRRPEGRCTWQRYWANAVDVSGPDTEALGNVARQTGTYLAIGVIERDTDYGGGTLYCTLLYFGPNGELLGNIASSSPPPPNA